MGDAMKRLHIKDFLPAYSQINVLKGDSFYSFYSNNVPAGYTREFPISTFLKKEFNDLKLETVEKSKLPGEQFRPLNSQSFVARFLSQYTPNDRLLVFHSVGAGKTCLASLLSETSQAVNPNLLETLILVRNETLQESFMNEIATTCTDGKYEPDMSDWKPKHLSKTSKATKAKKATRQSDDESEDIEQKPTRELVDAQYEETYKRRLRSNIRENYTFETFERFAKELAVNDEKYIRDVYSNRVIIIDEVHNIQEATKESDVPIYTLIWKFLHTVQNCKVILMTASPMRNWAKESASIFNLLLPIDKQFDVDNFNETYFNHQVFKEDMKEEFKSRIRGLVSYVRATDANVRKIYEGIVVKSYLGSTSKGMQKLSLMISDMSDLQSKNYEKAYKSDKKDSPDIEEVEEAEEELEENEASGGIYKNSRQASLFVGPDGSYGKDLDQKGWIDLSTESRDQREAAARYKVMSAEEREEAKIARRKGVAAKRKGTERTLHDKLDSASMKLRNWIFNGKEDPSDEEKLARLEILSTKYAGVIRQILANPNEKAFVYCSLVHGSGSKLFASLLELFGFSHAKLPTGAAREADMSKYKGKKHFMLIAGGFPTTQQAQFLINKVYNNPDNLYGDYIRVIVASRIAGEGVSFKHTRQFHYLTPWWNLTETYQAQGRVIRAFAHDVFSDLAERYVKIFYWCAMPSRVDFPSIDFDMYRVSEDKDYPIKQTERLMKEAAVDCALNAKRNMRPDLYQEDSRECDYSTCIYACDDIPAVWYSSPLSHPSLIEDTYNLYYARGQIDNIKDVLRVLFKDKFAYDFYELVHLLPEATELILIRALKEMIDQSISIVNKYGITSYLRESRNFYFLVDNHEFKRTSNLFLLSHYNASPVLKEDMSFKDYVDYFENEYLAEKMIKLTELDVSKEMSTAEGKANLARSFAFFDIKIQERLLESFVIAQERNMDFNVELRNAFLELYRASILVLDDGTIVSSLLYPIFKIYRCYYPSIGEWSECSSGEIGLHKIKATKKTAELQANPYGFTGLIDPKNPTQLKIVTIRKDVRRTAKGKIDKRVAKEKGKGQVCGWGTAFGQKRIIGILLRFGEIAEQNGQVPPSVWPYLTESERETVQRNATPEKVKELLDKIRAKGNTSESPKKKKKRKGSRSDESSESEEESLSSSKMDESIVPYKTLKEIVEFDEEKLERWYAILVYSNVNKTLCPTLKNWFNDVGLLEEAVD